MMAVSLAVTLVVQEMDTNSTRRVWGALDSFRSQFERPSKNECNRETQDHKQDYRARNRIGEMQRRNYRCRDLHHEPADNRVSDGHFVNVAPPQLSEEFPRVHRASPGVLMGANIFSTSASKRGSLRIGSHTGSSLKKDPIAPAARPRSN